MIVIFDTKLSQNELNEIKQFLFDHNIYYFSYLKSKKALCISGHIEDSILDVFKKISPVQNAKIIYRPYYLVTREFQKEDTIININNKRIPSPLIIGGPCSVSSFDSIYEDSLNLNKIDVSFLRFGLFKPRTSPYDFQGIGYDGLDLIKEIKEKTNSLIVSEIVSLDELEDIKDFVDVIQVGARNMQNFELLKALSKTKMPILLKRGFGASIDELLCAAEYILFGGNPNVILCERGIKTFENSTRYTLDLSAVSYLKKVTHLPVIVDPSHGTGSKDLVAPMALSAIAAGADGLMIECSTHPEEVWSDRQQCISIDELDKIIKKVNKIKKIIEENYD